MITGDPNLTPEHRTEALKADYKVITSRLPVGTSMSPKNLSVYRPEETGETLRQMEQNGPVIISGSHGAGKTSLMRLIEGEAESQGRPTLYLDTTLVVEDNDADNSTSFILDEASRAGLEADSIDSVLEDLKRKNGVLLVDEFTANFIDEENESGKQPLVSLMTRAAEDKVPLAFVVHSYPDILQKAYQQLSFADSSRIVVPRYATYDEIGQVMQSGSTYKRGEQPRMPDILEIGDDAVAEVAHLAGLRPAVINNFLLEFYFEQMHEEHPAAIITAVQLRDYFEKHKRKLVDSSSVRRVMRIGMDLLEDPNYRKHFMDMFLPNLEEIGSRNMTREDLKTVDITAIDPQLRDLWINIGLIRKDDDKLVVNGLLTGMAIVRQANG